MRKLLLAGLALAITLGFATLITRPAPNSYDVQGDRLFMSGEINGGTFDSFAAQIAAHPQVQTVVLMDMPGSIDEVAVHDLGYFIREERLNTHLTPQSQIYSGAVDVFLAGNTRTMTCCARIGVHDWADDYGDGSSYPVNGGEHDENVAYFEDMLGSDDFYWLTLQAAPSEDMHMMTWDELARFGMFTAPIAH